MPTETLRPDSTVLTNQTLVGSAATADEALSDDDDSTYVEGYGNTNLELEAHAIPSDALIGAVRILHRSRRGGDNGGEDHADIRTRLVLGQGSESFFASVGADSFTDYATSWAAESPQGGPWTVEDIDDLSVQLAHLEGSDSEPYYDGETAEITVEVDYNEPPEATLTAPSGTVTDTSRPTVEWDYSDAEDDPQNGFEVVVFDDADIDGTAPDDPDDVDADPVYESGTINTASTEHTLTDDLVNDATYRVYIRVRQAWDGAGEHWSAWDHGTFTLDLATAAASVTVTPDPTNARTLIEVAAGDDVTAEDPEWFRIQYRDDDTEDWKDLRGGDDEDRGHPVWFEGDPSTGGTAADWWAPFNTEREYRVRAYIEADGNLIASDSTYETGELVVAKRWLTDARDPDRLHTTVKLSDHKWKIRGREVVHRPAGMATAIVESEPPTRSDSVTVHSLDTDSHDDLEAALTSQRTLLFRDRREWFYFRWVGDRSRTQRSHDQANVDDWTGTMVEVDRPDPLT